MHFKINSLSFSNFFMMLISLMVFTSCIPSKSSNDSKEVEDSNESTEAVVTINSSTIINNTNMSSYTLSGTCSENNRVVSVVVGSVSVSDICASLAWSVTVDISVDGDSSVLAITADHDNASGDTAVQATTTVLKDTDVPSIINVLAPLAGTYYSGQNLDFSVVFSETIVVTGLPSIPITVGASSASAVYSFGSGTNTLVFRYVVESTDGDANGINNASPIALNTGTIKDLGLNNVDDLTFTPPSTLTVLVDGLGAVIVSITKPSNATYLAGSDLDFIINYNTLINVVGSPRMAIDIGGSVVYATYTSGSGSMALTFSYNVTALDLDTDGITLSSPLELNGGNFTVPSLGEVDLDFNLPNTSGILVNEILSPGIDIPTSAIYNEASAYTVLVKGNLLCTDTSISGDLAFASAGSLASCSVSGSTNTPISAQALIDLDIIYDALTTPACDQTLSGTLAGVTLTPGVYCFTGAATLTGLLTLDTEGDPNAFFIIRIGGALTATSFTVDMIGSGDPCNVYWGVMGATTTTSTDFKGNLVPSGAITMTGGSITGSLLSKAAVTLGGGTSITGCVAP